MTTVPTTQRAVVVGPEDGSVVVAESIPLPDIEPDAVLVQVSAVALNPVDTKMMPGFLNPGNVLGLDFAGTVVAVGPAQPAWRSLQVGDRVFGCTDGCDSRRPRVGAFTQFTACRGSILIKMPDHMSFATAASMGNAIFSSGFALFHSLQLPGSLTATAEKSHWVLIYGGATATGTMALQFLRRAGHKPIAVCSAKHFDMAREYGAVAAFDYHSESHVQEIRDLTKNALSFAFDCVTTQSSVLACEEAMGRLGGRYTALDPFDPTLVSRKAVKLDWILTLTLMGRGSVWPKPFGCEPDEALLTWGTKLAEVAEGVLAEGDHVLKAHPMRIMEGGLDAIPSGIDAIRQGQVRGFKLVYLL
ncbi:alcohol dehydrogenase, putative [Cordyceps militaris CM01]|uniref:Trans-enoyl reductase milB n=1 Tax=Cordyceps militaris (strain CM01) TaxID=983644 RepID=MILB_CORMM|nr:alcohol dehydrogenase, putative [Cordyceps militaris CM01]G3JUI7.1 RecName: Full=Trans-enoyl reductase milB; AltName: Full=Cordypyrones biosynthesis cluster protein B [Cordyceps militaris CM01]EGX87723.1 alcohol dehydrogenase, putative [Cordyceps militaris CM01]